MLFLHKCLLKYNGEIKGPDSGLFSVKPQMSCMENKEPRLINVHISCHSQVKSQSKPFTYLYLISSVLPLFKMLGSSGWIDDCFSLKLGSSHT